MNLRDETDVLVVVRNGNEVILYMDEDNVLRLPLKVWRQLNDEVEQKARAWAVEALGWSQT